MIGSKDDNDYDYRHETGSRDIFPILKANARYNRSHPTEAEMVIWEYLKGKRLGWKFRRQDPISDFIADFACIDKHLVIEVDGGYHNDVEKRREDEIRSEFSIGMASMSSVFTNEEVICDIQSVLDRINELLKTIE